MEKTLSKFLEFENKYKLFDKKIDNIYFWILIRKRILDNIYVEKGMVSKPDFTIDSNNIKNGITIIKYLFRALINWFKKYKKVKILIINHPRKILYNNEYIDIYTYDLQNKLFNKNKSFMVLDVPLNWGKHLLKNKKNVRNIENFSILKKIMYRNFKKNKYIDNKMLLEISNNLKKEFDCDGSLYKVFFEQINNFKIDYEYYTKLLKKIEPKKIYVVIAYVHFGLIKAAQDLGIEIEEIQHGIISKEHLAYHFPYNKKINYFPDSLSLFGKFWYDGTSIPVSENKIHYFENKILIDAKKEMKKKKENQIIFLGQTSITNKMIEYIQEFCELTNKYKIIVKLHPSEYKIWEEIYPELVKLTSKYKVEIIDNFNKPLYNLLMESKHAIGVSSTSLYEALYFECKVHLLNINTVETMDFLITNNMVTLSNNAKELLSNIEKNNSNDKIDLNYLFYKEEK